MGLRSQILSRPVSDLGLRPVITVSPTTTVRQAVSKMREAGLGCVVVVDSENRPLGKFTERLLIKLLLEVPGGLDQPVRDHMASAWGWVSQSEPIAVVIDRLGDSKLRFVVVLDKEGHPVGLTGQKGVMEYIADHFPRLVKVQQTESTLGMQDREGA